MTGSSHAAIFRITPEQDGPVHILLNHNSDEGEGYLEVDNQAKTIYGCNPVHRIYQGWGESAGFSGLGVICYDSLPLDGKTEVPLTMCVTRIQDNSKKK